MIIILVNDVPILLIKLLVRTFLSNGIIYNINIYIVSYYVSLLAKVDAFTSAFTNIFISRSHSQFSSVHKLIVIKSLLKLERLGYILFGQSPIFIIQSSLLLSHIFFVLFSTFNFSKRSTVSL